MPILIRRSKNFARSLQHARSAACGALVLLMSGCGHMMVEHPGEPMASNSKEVMGTKGVREFNAKGAILLGPNGELQAVDSQGNPVPVCAAPDAKLPSDSNSAACEKIKSAHLGVAKTITLQQLKGTNCQLVQWWDGTYRLICW